MRYRLRLLSASGRKIGAVKFERDSDSEAIATAIERQGDGPVDLWVECQHAAWLLFRSQAVIMAAPRVDRVQSPFMPGASLIGKRSRKGRIYAGRRGVGHISSAPRRTALTR